MYYDTLTLAAVVDELRPLLVGGRVQKIVQSGELSLGLEIYSGRRHELLLSAEADSARVLLAPAKLRRGREVSSPLHLLLLKYVRDARLEDIQQPSLERVVRFSFQGDFGPVELICELMGRYSNLILLGPDGVIMEAIKRIPASLNRYRTTLPAHPYVAPPPQQKEDPLLLSALGLHLALDRFPDGNLAQRLVSAVSGISPILAREIVFRATGRLDPPLPLAPEGIERLLDEMTALLRLPQTHAWSPCVAFAGESDERRPAAYAAYELTHYPDREPVPSISAAINRVLEARQSFDPYKQGRARVHGFIAEQAKKQASRLAALQRSLVPPEEIERLQLQGSAILALAWQIKPRQRELVVDPAQFRADPSAEGAASAPMYVTLDPALTPSENAQKLFHTYRKMKAAAAEVPALIVGVEREIAYLRQLAAEVDLAENRLQIDEVERELAEAGYGGERKGPKPTGRSRPLSLRAEDGTLILVGRNSAQNDEVTFRRGTPDDLWLHAHGVPGSHVIVKSAGRAVAEKTLQLAARLAAHYSSARGEARVVVDYTPRRHVRHIKDAHPGMVTYTHEQTLTVSPEGDDLAALLAQAR